MTPYSTLYAPGDVLYRDSKMVVVLDDIVTDRAGVLSKKQTVMYLSISYPAEQNATPKVLWCPMSSAQHTIRRLVYEGIS